MRIQSFQSLEELEFSETMREKLEYPLMFGDFIWPILGLKQWILILIGSIWQQKIIVNY